MLCRKPYTSSKGLIHRCGRCMPCRITTQRTWTCRVLLETLCHPWSCFVTLTLSDSALPTDLSVSVCTVQTFLKNLRFYHGKLRYLMVGEYGSLRLRPHYHGLLWSDRPILEGSLMKSWKHGFVSVGSVSLQSARYCVGYTMKGLTKAKDVRLEGRSPEFMRCSTRPGLGALAIPRLAEHHWTEYGAQFVAEHGDVITQVRFGGKIFHIGRYLTAKLRDAVGLDAVDSRREEKLLSEENALKLLPDLYWKRENMRLQHSRIAEHRQMERSLRKKL